MKIEQKINVFPEANFQVEKFKADGNISYKSAVFRNMVLNTTIDLLENSSVDNLTRYLNIGSSDTPVEVTQTGLLDRKFSTDNIFNNQNYSTLNYLPFSYEITKVFQFNIGTCTGTFKEMGLSGANNSQYFNRALIKNAQGDLEPITVASDEGLRITVKIKVTLGNEFKYYSQIYRLKLNGGTPGTITFLSNGTTITTQSYFFTTEFTLRQSGKKGFSYFTAAFRKLHPANNEKNNPVACVVKDENGDYLIFGRPMNENDLNLTIQSHTLTGGTGPTLETVEPFVNQTKTFTFNHWNETTNVTTEITAKIKPYTQEGGSFADREFVWGGDIYLRALITSPYGNWGIIPEGAGTASSSTLVENIWLDANTKKKTIKYYWPPAALSANTVTLTTFFIRCYGVHDTYYEKCELFLISFEPGITITNVEEFEMTYSILWGRLT